MRIAVYCGARHGARPAYSDAAHQLGASLATRGHDLIYGGGHVGLMGVVADAVMAGGQQVTGVITEHLFEREIGHDAVTELIIVRDMAERKREMFNRSDAFIALPGGLGTLEELFEVLCWRSLDIHAKPVGLLDVDGYWQSMMAFLDHGAAEGFITPLHLDHLSRSSDVDHLLDELLDELLDDITEDMPAGLTETETTHG